jgi:hypothetical protein
VSRLSPRGRLPLPSGITSPGPAATGRLSLPLGKPVTPLLVSARYLDGYRIALAFADGKRGVVDMRDELWGDEFEPLADLDRFKAFRIDPALGTLVWPTGAQLTREYLYERTIA